MQAIIIKELRENAKWAVLILLALGALMAGAVDKDFYTGLSLVGTSIQMVTLLGFLSAGFALGLLQIFQDRRHDRWSFVIHRPISRTRIFFAKVIAGVLLYVLTTAIPLVAVIAWASIPGHIRGPFDWHMALPRVADLFGGLMWYAGGLLVASRKARWLGSRLLPLGLPYFASLAAHGLSLNLGEALLWPFGGILILVPAAWGAFVFGGEYEPQPLIVRLMQSLTMAPAVGILCLFASLATETNSTFSGYAVDTKGNVVQLSYAPGKQPAVVDLQGKSVWSAGITERFISFPGNGGFLRDSGTGYWRFQDPQSYLTPIYTGETEWFYVPTRRTLEGFKDEDYVGSIGPNGFAPASQPAVPFAESLDVRGFQIVNSQTTAYRLDLTAPGIRPVFHTTLADPILNAEGVGVTRDLPPGSTSSKSYWIVTRSAAHILKDDHEVGHVPMEQNWQDYLGVYLGETTDGLLTLRYAVPAGQTRTFEKVVEADASGKIITKIDLPPIPIQTVHESGWLRGLQSLAIPPGIQFFLFYKREHISFSGILTAVGMGAVWLGVTLFLFRRYTASNTAKIFWAVLNLFLGLPGILLLLCLRQPQAMVRCHSCRRKRIVTRILCKHCNSPFAKPSMEGIEVFELA